MKFLINRSDAIGDVLLTMPMAKLIKDKYPDAIVIFIISPKTADLLKHHPYIDGMWILDQKKSIFSNLAQLYREFRKWRPDNYLYVGGSQLPSFMARLLRVKFRGGLKSRWPSFLFLNGGVRQKRSIVAMHESEYNLNLLTPLGLNFHYTDRLKFAPVINLLPPEREQAWSSFLKDLKEQQYLDVEKPELIFIHPGMTGHTLNWASRNYARLIERLEKNFPDRFLYIISFTPVDEVYLGGLRDQLKKEECQFLQKKVYFFDGSKQGLRHYMGVLSHAKLFIGPSTGNTHIANALDVPQIGIYSPIRVQSALRWGPYKRVKKENVVVPDVICGEPFECLGEGCRYFECMSKVEVEDVYKAACSLGGF